jgi:hypothetical protein
MAVILPIRAQHPLAESRPAPVTVRLHGNAGRVWNGGAVDVQDY